MRSGSVSVRLGAVAGIVALAALTASCATEAPAEDDTGAITADSLVAAGVAEVNADLLVDLYEKALEGDSTLYFYGSSADALKPVFEVFEEIFPELSVEGVNMSNPDAIARITAEQESGQVIGGMLQMSDTLTFPMGEAGYLQDYALQSEVGLPDEAHSSMFDLTSAFMATYAPAYTTGLDADLVPQSWHEVITDPKYKGRIAAVDPKIAGVTNTTVAFLANAGEMTERDYRELLANEPTWFPDTGSSSGAVSQGEFDVLLTNSYSNLTARKAAGLDIQIAYPMSDANVLTPLFLGLLNGAPNQAGVELLYEFFFTHPAQEAGSVAYIPIVEGAPSISGGLPALSDIPNPVYSPPLEKSSSVTKQWIEWFSAN